MTADLITGVQVMLGMEEAALEEPEQHMTKDVFQAALRVTVASKHPCPRLQLTLSIFPLGDCSSRQMGLRLWLTVYTPVCSAVLSSEVYTLSTCFALLLSHRSSSVRTKQLQTLLRVLFDRCAPGQKQLPCEGGEADDLQIGKEQSLSIILHLPRVFDVDSLALSFHVTFVHETG
jgi:hypothetical protein